MPQIDPFLEENIGKALWVVDVSMSTHTPIIQCVKIHPPSGPYNHVPTIWGYSVYQGSPGFRTIGRELNGYLEQYPEMKFFDVQQDAVEEMLKGVTPEGRAMYEISGCDLTPQ